LLLSTLAHALIVERIDDSQRTRAGELKIRPATSEGDWYRWLEGIQDWCISRQLWWGHRAPAYFVKIEGVDQQDVSCSTLCIQFARSKTRNLLGWSFPFTATLGRVLGHWKNRVGGSSTCGGEVQGSSVRT